MVLLNVVCIYDLSLITPSFFLPAARYFVSGRELQCLYVFGGVGVQALVYLRMYAGGLRIRDLGKVESGGHREIFDPVGGERSGWVMFV